VFCDQSDNDIQNPEASYFWDRISQALRTLLTQLSIVILVELPCKANSV